MSLFDIAEKKQELENLEAKTLEQDFWNDSKESGKVLAKIKSLKDDNTSYAIYKAEKMLNKDKVSGMYIFGNEKDLEKINVDDLYYKYKNIILNSKLQVIVSGNLKGYEK